MAMMNELEKRALRKHTTSLVELLDPKIYVLDVLYSEEALTDLEYEDLIEIPNRVKQCRELLMLVRRKCSMNVFLRALTYNNAFTFLAEQLRATQKALEEEERKKNAPEEETEKRTCQNGVEDPLVKGTCPLCKCPARINTLTTKKKLLTKMQQHLKYLCMNGNTNDHHVFLENLSKKWEGDADVKFVIFDAMARDMRVSSSEVTEDNGAFKSMESLIPYTSDPTTSSMTFLARKASVFDLKGRARDGLTVLGYAKTHAERVVPCRDTGLVIYMEINLLLKDYEADPSEEKKNIIVDRIKEAIEVHFSQEEHEIKEDCSRMLYVKMACFYLGLGLLGNRMANSSVSAADLKSAECVLNRLEATWEHMDARRKMFYYLARAVLSQYQNQTEKALHFGEIARQMAEKGNCNRELANIDPLTRDLAIEIKKQTTQKGDEILKEFENLHNGGEHVRVIPRD